MALKGLRGVHEGGGLQGAPACLSYQAVTASQRCSLNGPQGKQGSQHLSALQRRGGGWGGGGVSVHSRSWVPTAERPARALLPGPEGSSEHSVTSHNSKVPTAQTGTRGPA